MVRRCVNDGAVLEDDLDGHDSTLALGVRLLTDSLSVESRSQVIVERV